MSSSTASSAPSPEAVASAKKHYKAVLECFPVAIDNFERKWAAWHAICLVQASAEAKPDKCTDTEQFDALKKLGPKIITIVVHKLATDGDGHSFYGVFLYNAIENDPGYRVEPDPEETANSIDTLRKLSAQIVELNYQRNQVFETRVQAWSQFHRDNWLRGSSLAFTMTDEYFDLVDMGTSIIAPVMVSYYHLNWGYWWQLLHELIHGRQVGAYSYQPGAIYEACVQWFNEGDHVDAPLYEQTEEDKRFFGEPWSTKNNEAAP